MLTTRRSVVVGLVATVAAPSMALGASVTLTVEPIDVDRGEDGRGRDVAADEPYALLLRAEHGWPARALDPVLAIGALRFHHYVHIDRVTLRFVVDRVARLHEGDLVHVQYGGDERSRIRLGSLVRTW